mmetsp:Transcript_68451/g.184256  ORF Transcript_68451/g.184256 Transcript_68451/m.184256 type:complete len:417 (-) Transcript_68451:591-1841(-)
MPTKLGRTRRASSSSLDQGSVLEIAQEPLLPKVLLETTCGPTTNGLRFVQGADEVGLDVSSEGLVAPMRDHEEEGAPGGRQNALALGLAKEGPVVLADELADLPHDLHGHPHGRVVRQLAGVAELGGALEVLEGVARPELLRHVRGRHREVVDAQDHVLRGADHRLSRCWRAEVARRHHQCLQLLLCLPPQPQVDGHSVAVEVCIEGCRHEGVDAQGLSFDEPWSEGLHAQAVQGGRSVQQHEPVLHAPLDQVPLRFEGQIIEVVEPVVDGHILGLREILGHLVHPKAAVETVGNLEGQRALVHPQRRIAHDDRSRGVVHALAQHVGAHAPKLALEASCHRLHCLSTAPHHWQADSAVVDHVVAVGLNTLLEVADQTACPASLQDHLERLGTIHDVLVEDVQVVCEGRWVRCTPRA